LQFLYLLFFFGFFAPGPTETPCVEAFVFHFFRSQPHRIFYACCGFFCPKPKWDTILRFTEPRSF
jgi:hypothetical protein